MSTEKNVVTQGKNIIGLFLGLRSRDNVDRSTGEHKGKIFEAGVRIDMPDGFGGTKQDQFVLRLSKAQIQAGTGMYSQFEGKVCAVPFFESIWQNGKGSTLFLGQGQIVPLV